MSEKLDILQFCDPFPRMCQYHIKNHFRIRKEKRGIFKKETTFKLFLLQNRGCTYFSGFFLDPCGAERNDLLFRRTQDFLHAI